MAILLQLRRHVLKNTFRKVIRGIVALLKVATVCLSVALVIAAALAFIITIRPQWILNDHTARYLANKPQWTGYQVKADILSLSVTSESWRRKHVRIEVQDFAISPVVGEAFSAEGRSFRIEIGIDLLGDPIVLAALGPIDLIDSNVQITLKNELEENKEPFQWSEFLNSIRHIDFRPISARNFTLALTDAAGKIQSVRINASTIFDGSAATLSATVTALSKGMPFRELTVDGRADANYGINTGASAGVKFRLNAGGGITSGQFESRFSEPQRHDYHARIVLPRQIVHGDAIVSASGSLQGNTLSMQVNGFHKPQSNVIRQATMERCHINATLSNEGIHPERATADECVVTVSFQAPAPEAEQIIPTPDRMTFDISGKVATSGPNRQRVDGDLSARIRTFEGALYRVRGEAGLSFFGNTNALASSTVTLNSDITVEADRFENTVSHLEKTRLAVPAPLNSLEGKLACHLRGTISTREGTAIIPVTCFTDLKDRIQSLVTSITGQIIFELETKKTSLTAEAVLDDVKIAAPNIEITAGIPKVRPDQRFVTGLDPNGFFRDGEWIDPVEKKTDVETKQFPINYQIRVRTGREPFRVASGLTDQDVPIDFDLAIASADPLTGYAAVRPFTVTVVKKKIAIERGRIDFQRDGDRPITGVVSLEKTNQKIIVDIFGTANRPRYQITSDPPVSESDAVAGLLYDSTSLNAAQQTSVAETRAAMADGAIGLISMFFLASTPVESVGYNPNSGVFSANVRVQDGVSLQVGSSFEGEKRVGIVKNLWGKWSFEAFALSGTTDEQGRGVAMFRWSNRY